MYAAERQAMLAGRLLRDGRLVVVELAAEFGVSGETVRRDLAVLEREGLAQRVHGGAVPARSLLGETALAQRETQYQQEKKRIAQVALDFVPDGGSIGFDAGSSVEQLVDALPTDAVATVLTHAVPIAAKLTSLETADIHVIGGRIRGITGAAVGQHAVEAYRHTRLDVAFVGTNGISESHGFSTHDADEAAVKRALVGAARRVVMLADSSKLGAEPIFTFADLADVDVLVTDSGANDDALAPLREAGIEVLRA
ncbi:D-beta-D-heptose 1-phosphate adenosyltransferase [Aeromicrobium sp. PE09-221]|uniref:DeoR/GlpR family DNA-binding transcription regulator n=1 Tax=Aeromicrobium sp. PE09-221 TaxID=1898043 RepID=UPI000B3E8DBE|nr:DeoR/GlpR family DNA-binding transcription regulator [Aeromicrobium sp. PE09-221]OUZ11723.1 D-beta-D-heptose 1-phosphate adenosyltransferase [Aeromicrobium sp. PE09-221]